MFTVGSFKLERMRRFFDATSQTRTTRCAQNRIHVDKIFVRRKRKENREFPFQRLQFQTRVDRWVLITALCVVEWNAQHNWLVCINVGGVFSSNFHHKLFPSKFHNFRPELEIVNIACLGDISNSKSLFKCNQTWQPRVSKSLSGVSRSSFFKFSINLIYQSVFLFVD